ncbi:SDR family NAD(P)-dependent oxidoreductase [Pseudomonas sp. NPDC089408]|uniref:SDR family NAD(P)-dependent oxidoreductase n=1 Tax=Pseudomonas sp. NPDC089408 TaxID=3364465 RepID=UPI00381D1D09
MTQVAFITGASRGIGRETAMAFARAGFDVAISARTVAEGAQAEHRLLDARGVPLPGSLDSTASAIRALGRQALIVPMDLLDSDSVLAASQAVLAAYGRIDVLVNNAIYQGNDLNAAYMSLQPQTLERVFKGYVLAPLLLTQAVLAAMLAQGVGVVINVTSGAGESDPPVAAAQGGWGYAYGAGKAAVSRAAGVIATELGGQGIRAYTVNPGVVTTDALKATLGESGLLALRVGTAPPHVPAQVMVWLATCEQAARFQRRTIAAQPFALEHGIVDDWR